MTLLKEKDSDMPSEDVVPSESALDASIPVEEAGTTRSRRNSDGSAENGASRGIRTRSNSLEGPLSPKKPRQRGQHYRSKQPDQLQKKKTPKDKRSNIDVETKKTLVNLLTNLSDGNSEYHEKIQNSGLIRVFEASITSDKEKEEVRKRKEQEDIEALEKKRREALDDTSIEERRKMLAIRHEGLMQLWQQQVAGNQEIAHLYETKSKKKQLDKSNIDEIEFVSDQTKTTDPEAEEEEEEETILEEVSFGPPTEPLVRHPLGWEPLELSHMITEEPEPLAEVEAHRPP